MIKAIVQVDDITRSLSGKTIFRVVIPLDYKQEFSNQFLNESSVDIKCEFAKIAEERISNFVFGKEKSIVKNVRGILSCLRQDENTHNAIKQLDKLYDMFKVEVE